MIVTSRLEDRVIEEVPAHIFYRNRCQLFGNKIAVIEHRTGRTLTFNDVLHEVERLAGAFQELGMSARDRVALHGNNSIDIFLAYLAVHFINATIVACKTTLVVREMVYQCATANVKFIIADDAAYETVILANMESPPASHPELMTVTQLLLTSTHPFSPPKDVCPREDEILITFTSGTTGLPKGVLHTHFTHQSQLICSSEEGTQVLRGSGTILQWCPISHVSGSIFFPLAIYIGATSVVANTNQDLENFVNICETYRVTELMVFPVILQRLIEILRQAPGACRSVKHVVVGGSTIFVSWSEALIGLLELQSYRILYGMSECFIVTITEDNKCTTQSVGRPYPNTRMKVIDTKNGSMLNPYEKGELAVKSDFIMKSYDKRPDATSEAITKEGWLLTGDYGYMDKEGKFYICERLKQMIKCLDNQLSPAELEDLLLQNVAVKEAIVIGLPDKKYGEAPTAYIVLNKGHSPSDELKQELLDMVKREFAYYKHLYGGVFFVDELPKTDNGKFARVELRSLVTAGQISIINQTA
ncbi:4-coumarate--CoA ligase 1-like isoform X2 [Varroa destructor]|uniref:Uncharacterized protein n=1 Tax=Varroa destructor TaxID=109461 RepID=A0A7M7M7T9_VARDE|nr:4-coumarate--CoA ligase 1-like isoform X2 [Varroa destructor]